MFKCIYPWELYSILFLNLNFFAPKKFSKIHQAETKIFNIHWQQISLLSLKEKQTVNFLSKKPQVHILFSFLFFLEMCHSVSGNISKRKKRKITWILSQKIAKMKNLINFAQCSVIIHSNFPLS